MTELQQVRSRALEPASRKHRSLAHEAAHSTRRNVRSLSRPWRCLRPLFAYRLIPSS